MIGYIKKRLCLTGFVYTLLLAVAFGPAIFGKFSLYPMTYAGRSSDYLTSDKELLENIEAGGIYTDAGASDWVEIPMVLSAARSVRNGELPLWNCENSLGMPVIDNNNGSTLAPFAWPLYIHDSEMMWNMMYLLRILFAMIGTWLFLEEIGIRYELAVVGGIIFGFSGYVMLYFNIFFFHVDAFLPMLMWMTARIAKKISLRRWIAVTLLVAAMCLGGNPQNLITCCMLAVSYYMFWMLLKEKQKGNWKKILLYLCSYPSAVLLTMGYWLSFFTLYQNGYSYHANAGMQTRTMEELMGFIIPVGRFAARYRAWMPYLGGSVVLVIFTQLILKRTAVYLKEKIFFCTFNVLFILKIIGFPLVQELGKLPILNELGFVKYNSPVYFSFAVLAVFALNDMLANQNRIRIGLQCMVLALAAVFFGVVYWKNLIAQAERANAYLKVAAIGLVVIVTVMFAGWMMQKLWLSKCMVLLLICVELLSYPISQQKILPPKGAAFSEPDFIQKLKEQREHSYDRVFCVGNLLIGNLSALYGVSSVGGISPLPELHYWNFMNEFVINHHADLQMVTAQSSKYDPYSKKYLDMLGAKFFMVDDYGEIADDALELVYDSGRLKIYKNRTVFEKAYTVHNAIITESEEETFAMLRQKNLDLAKSAVIESSREIKAEPLTGTEQDKVEIKDYCSNSVRIQCHMASDGILVLSDLYYPGWKVYVNGQREDVLRVNDVLRGVCMGKGENDVEFVYEPLGLRAGICASMGSAVLFMVGVLWYKRKHDIKNGQSL